MLFNWLEPSLLPLSLPLPPLPIEENALNVNLFMTPSNPILPKSLLLIPNELLLLLLLLLLPFMLLLLLPGMATLALIFSIRCCSVLT